MTDRDQLSELAKAVRSFLAEDGWQGEADVKRLEEAVKKAEESLAENA